MSLEVQNIEGKSTGKKVDLNKEIFGIEPNDHVIYLDVKWYLAHKRQGTSKSKERAEIKGSTRKIKKQKGTGTARAGSIKNPLFRGGGTVFGPKPRNYDFKLNKKVKRLARKSALAYKAQEGNIIVLEDFNMEEPKTKEFKSILEKIGVLTEKSLFLLPAKNEQIELSARNLKKANVRLADTITSYEVLHADKLIVTESALETLNNYLVR